MRYKILLLISLFCVAPAAFSDASRPSASLKVFIDPNTGTFSQIPAKKPSLRTVEKIINNNSIEPQVIDSPVAGGGKMVHVHGLLNSDFVIHKTIHGWQTQCHLNETH